MVAGGGRGAYVVAGGMHVCWGGMCGCRGACMVAGGHVWLQGACMVEGGVCVAYDEIGSMSGQYASYWNAFLLLLRSHFLCVQFQISLISSLVTHILT